MFVYVVMPCYHGDVFYHMAPVGFSRYNFVKFSFNGKTLKLINKKL